MPNSKKKSTAAKTHQKSDFDSGWKDALIAALEEFINLLFPDIHSEIDWSKPFRLLDKELREVLRDLKQGKRNADLLVEVFLKNGQSLIHHLHIEVQAEWEADFPERVYHYNYRFSALLKQPVSSLVIYADSNPNWKPDTYTWQCPAGKTTNTFTFDSEKILDFNPRRAELMDLVSKKNMAAMVVLAQLDAIEAKGDSPKKLEMRKSLIRMMFEAGFSREKIIELFRILDHILFLKPPEKLTFKDWMSDYLQEIPMPLVSTFDIICDEREEKGRTDLAVEFCERLVGKLPEKTKEAIQELDREAVLELQVIAAETKSTEALQDWIAKQT